MEGTKMTLLEEVLAARERERAGKNKPSCDNCKHLFWLDEKTPFCRKVDKFILPDLPPTKCELREV